MLDFASPQDDSYHDSDEDSSVSTIVSKKHSHLAKQLDAAPRRTSSIDDCKRIAVQRAKYFRRKYAAERLIAAGLFVAVAPLIALLIALVRMTSKGPGIYRQRRVGLHGETFDVYKLRSMRTDAELGGKPVWSGKNDTRITPVGKFLRASHLDELPQLWNVLKGEMSLTGPRPERPEICEVLATIIDDYYHRNVVKPGVTGLAQINLEPDETVADVKRKQFLDLQYIQNAGPWLDARMVMGTGLRIFFIKGERAMRWMCLCRRSLVEESVVVLQEDNRKLFADSKASKEPRSAVKQTDQQNLRCDVPHLPR